MSFKPLISVIVPTYGREAILVASLQDILGQNYQPIEIIVIDQTPQHQPETTTFLTNLHEQKKIQWLRVSWANLPGARNYGVSQAKGEILIFIDDDVKLTPEFVANHAINYQRDSAIGAVAGRVFDRMKLQEAQQIYQNDSYSLDFLPPEAQDPGIAWYYLDFVHTTQPQQVISARGCNMSFRREIFSQWGLRFDERFRGSAVREEADFCLQLRKTGFHIWYDPNAFLIHLGEETGGCHEISTRSLEYQFTFYHNHFLMAFKNLTWSEQWRLYQKLFDCHVLGHPPCDKDTSLLKVLVRGLFYALGFLKAAITQITSIWNDGQVYTRQNPATQLNRLASKS
jgi:GT2 family glycosyltransferase